MWYRHKYCLLIHESRSSVLPIRIFAPPLDIFRIRSCRGWELVIFGMFEKSYLGYMYLSTLPLLPRVGYTVPWILDERRATAFDDKLCVLKSLV